MHSSEYTDPTLCRDKDVVVLGGSKSGTDIAVNAANNGAKSVRLVYKENVWRVPYYVGGINFKNLLYMRAQEQQFNRWGKSPLQRVITALFKTPCLGKFSGFGNTSQASIRFEKT